jgi:hypothetical protein
MLAEHAVSVCSGCSSACQEREQFRALAREYELKNQELKTTIDAYIFPDARRLCDLERLVAMLEEKNRQLIMGSKCTEGELSTLREAHDKSCKDNLELIKRIEQVKQQYESSTQRGMDLERKLHDAQESLTAALENKDEANRLLIQARCEVHTLEKHIKQREDEIKELKRTVQDNKETWDAAAVWGKSITETLKAFIEGLQRELADAKRLAQSRLNDVTAVAEENNRLKAENQKALEELSALRGARAGNELWTALDQVRTLETQLEQKRVRLGAVEQERDQLVKDKARLSTLAQDNANKAEENLRMYVELKTDLGALMRRR